MTIRYANGETFEAVLLSRTDSAMRVAMREADDIVELNRIHDSWVTSDCEPVQVLFAWQQQEPKTVPTEAECICSPELAARLIHLLESCETVEAKSEPAAVVPFEAMAAAALVV